VKFIKYIIKSLEQNTAEDDQNMIEAFFKLNAKERDMVLKVIAREFNEHAQEYFAMIIDREANRRSEEAEETRIKALVKPSYSTAGASIGELIDF
jgi:hypothetical protein